MNCLYQSKRISDLKEKMLSSQRYASIEQARIITRVYQENEDLSIPKKRALSLKVALEELEISVEDEELIVGNRTKGVRYGVIFPESGCSWINKEFETLPTRDQDKFLVREEDIKEFKENIKVRKQCATLAFLVYRFENTFYEGQHCPEVEEWRDICTGEKSENEFAEVKNCWLLPEL